MNINQFFNSIDINDLVYKVENFQKLNIETITPAELTLEIFNVMMFNGKNVLLPYTTCYPSGTLFYRIRKPWSEMKVLQDAWNAPSDAVKRGRLNKDGESLLYICPNIITAIKETKTNPNEEFALIIYEANQTINANCIGDNKRLEGLNHQNKIKMKMINNFLTYEFTRDVEKGKEYLYKISESIAKDCFVLPPHQQDAWRYPSVADDKNSVNLCMKPNIAKEKLILKDIQLISSHQIIDNSPKLDIDFVGKPNENDELCYSPFGSIEQQNLFPSITD